MKILAVNPGSTSTKIAVYEDETPRLVLNIRHSVEELSQFPRIIDQFEFRKHLVLEALEANDIPFKFDAIVGRGGLLKPIPGGVYAVNDAMLDDMLHAMRTHACNLGCLIAHDNNPILRHAVFFCDGLLKMIGIGIRITIEIQSRGCNRFFNLRAHAVRILVGDQHDDLFGFKT